jgi:hypothetical protein
LIRQLRDARKEVACLKVEILTERRKMKEVMDMYNETLDLVRFTRRIFLPLHRQLKTLYSKKKAFNPKTGSSRKNCNPSRMI